MKVNSNYMNQLHFLENFLVELTLVYVHSFPTDIKKDKFKETLNLVKETLGNMVNRIPKLFNFEQECPKCGIEVDKGARFCSQCGHNLIL